VRECARTTHFLFVILYVNILLSRMASANCPFSMRRCFPSHKVIYPLFLTVSLLFLEDR
jgi:hypothetical protein